MKLGNHRVFRPHRQIAVAILFMNQHYPSVIRRLALILGFVLITSASLHAMPQTTTAQLANLQPLATEDLPRFGTYWVLKGPIPGKPIPPTPFPPTDLVNLGVPVYAMGNGQFIVDDSQVDYVALRQQQALDHVVRSLMLQNGLDDDPPIPGEMAMADPQLPSTFHDTNELWLEVSISNTVASFIIHTPEVAAYDIFGTTSLATDVAGLNRTNWVWLMRTDVGQTNNLVLTNRWMGNGFFRLGTMLDSDGDGLTDAYERLVSHTDPTKWDTDGDGLSDGWEVEHGMDPNVDESAQTSGRLNYQYDGAGWLRVISGAAGESITLDAEGNVQQVP